VPKNSCKIISHPKSLWDHNLQRQEKFIFRKSKLDLLIVYYFCGYHCGGTVIPITTPLVKVSNMSGMQFSVGQKISILYQGKENNDGPKMYEGVIDKITTPKTTNKQLLTVKLVDGGFKSFYPDQAIAISEK